jgi:phosphatidate cytidylyltransferase
MTNLHTSAEKEAQTRSNLRVRALTSFVLGPIVLVITFVGGVAFTLLGLALAAFSMLEFSALGADRKIAGIVTIGLPAVLALVLAFSAHEYGWVLALFVAVSAVGLLLEILRRPPERPPIGKRTLYTLLALIYSGLPPAFMIELRAMPDGLIWIVFVFFITWGTDTLAFFGGRMWGKHKLAPRISPKKTVEGALVGIIGGAALALLLLANTEKLTALTAFVALAGPVVAVAGDLFESGLKRYFHAGDSHIAGLNIIPGHGGVLDRTDSLIWVAALCYAAFKIAGITF